MNADRPIRIVIAGAGFGGVHTYLNLHTFRNTQTQLDITLISDSDRFVFTPMIHEVATGNLLPASIIQPIRTLPHCCLEEFMAGTIVGVDADKKIVTVRDHTGPTKEDDGHIREVPYDYLVLGLGSETNYFGVPGADTYAFPLKDIMHAAAIKNHIIESFERAEESTAIDEQRALLRFVIVGGGPTGVELAGELADLVTVELSNAFSHLKDLVSIVIVERGTTLLGNLDTWFSEHAEKILEQSSVVYTMYETSVEEVTAKGVKTNKGFVDAHTVIWSAGVKAREIPITGKHTLALDERSRRIIVNPELNTTQYPEIFVLGDQAQVIDPNTEKPYPMRAQFAVRQGKTVAHNIVHMHQALPLKAFTWKEQGLIISLGKGGALAQVFGIRFTGPFAWFVYRTAYLLAIVGWRAKIRTALEWTLNLFLPRDVSKL